MTPEAEAEAAEVGARMDPPVRFLGAQPRMPGEAEALADTLVEEAARLERTAVAFAHRGFAVASAECARLAAFMRRVARRVSG